MACCLCGKRLERAVHELRNAGPGCRPRVFHYCWRCRRDMKASDDHLRSEPAHSRSSLGATHSITVAPVRKLFSLMEVA